jgi:hypothetical protein
MAGIPRQLDVNDSGDGISGTNRNAAWLTTIYDSIDTGWAKTTYTPVWSSTGAGEALGNGTIAGTHHRKGTFVPFSVLITFGSTTNFGSAGFYSVTLPFTADAASPFSISVFASDASASGALYGGAGYLESTTSCLLLMIDTSAVGVYGPTTPITFAQNDVIRVGGWFYSA